MDKTQLFWGVGLLAAALLLVAVEVFIPSAGLISIVALVAAIAGLVNLYLYDAVWGLAGTLAVAVLTPIVVFAGLNVWRHTPLGRRMIGAPTEEQEEADRSRLQDELDSRAALIGEEGVALTDLRPAGVVEVDGKRYDALAETVLIHKGRKVRITGADRVQVKVRPRDGG